ncbi:Uncharacterised protein [Salmonella enterica subsp. enterica serovar Bovismorbificans]|uniref:Uncharacterized protein n=1 Tax=Salmonella enterica subsp. enterica serovar Bovismorbificans TaxID=58097 RepID=A0A655BUN3_SALET|nr:Uncharacterised protein [Salmonella enterica subsp. enterica serovar Bovismorbificans]
MATTNAATTGFYRAAQKTYGSGVVIALRFQLFHPRLCFIREEFRNDAALAIGNALRRTETDHFFRFQFNGELSGNLF